MSWDDDMNFLENLNAEIERVSPSDYLTAFVRDRHYDGQPHTDLGERGKQLVSGLTFRDLRDCFVIGCFEASGLQKTNYPKSLYELPWDEMDPIAVFQCMSCQIEKRMDIFPNIPKLNRKATT